MKPQTIVYKQMGLKMAEINQMEMQYWKLFIYDVFFLVI